MIAAWGLQIGCQMVRKIVLNIVCLAYSLLSLLLLLLVVVVVFTLLSYEIVFISVHKFPLLSISPPHPAGGKGKDERAAVFCLAASCWVKLQQTVCIIINKLFV